VAAFSEAGCVGALPATKNSTQAAQPRSTRALPVQPGCECPSVALLLERVPSSQFLKAEAGWPKDLAKEMAELALRAVHSQEEVGRCCGANANSSRTEVARSAPASSSSSAPFAGQAVHAAHVFETLPGPRLLERFPKPVQRLGARTEHAFWGSFRGHLHA